MSDLILAFDTSGAHCAVALCWADRHIARWDAMAKGQAEHLVPMIEQMLLQAGVSWQDISKIAVGTGPGNFTGIRISVALARGLALGRGIPAIGVTGFEARAFGADVPDYWVTIPAPRDQLYAQRAGGAAQMVADFDDLGLPVLPDLAPDALVLAIGSIARVKAAAARPAPFYLRAADALPPSDPPPVILP